MNGVVGPLGLIGKKFVVSVLRQPAEDSQYVKDDASNGGGSESGILGHQGFN